MKDINSLEHTEWRCQYHIVFAPKYRRQVIYREIRTDIGQILRKLCESLYRPYSIAPPNLRWFTITDKVKPA